MKYHTKCEHCGHQVTAYTYSLNVGKVRALRSLVDKYEETRKPVELGTLGLTNSQYTNFCHLPYFGLAQYIPGEGWVPTPKGIMFIEGHVAISMPVAVMGGEVLPNDHEAWQTATRQPKLYSVRQIDETSYKQKVEYQQEKSMAASLF